MSNTNSIIERLTYPKLFDSFNNPCKNCLKAPMCKWHDEEEYFVDHESLANIRKTIPTKKEIDIEFESYMKGVYEDNLKLKDEWCKEMKVSGDKYTPFEYFKMKNTLGQESKA